MAGEGALLASHLEIESANARCIMTSCPYKTFGRYGSSSPCPSLFAMTSPLFQLCTTARKSTTFRTGHLPNCGLICILIRQSSKANTCAPRAWPVSPKWILTSLTFRLSSGLCPSRPLLALPASVSVSSPWRVPSAGFSGSSGGTSSNCCLRLGNDITGNPQGLHVRRGFIEIWQYRFPDRSMQ